MLAGLPYWYSITHDGLVAASSLAVATAVLDPPSAAEKIICAP
ncbi:Uncharacterised protein [Mycobacterium tuberculosis]|uniref:Uncharacterized protein n=1 Tax=Mycobacterium tuberculosis TaxID=1773 RepID=A0A654U5X6_MYCTX|nr:Uncharacterised protein [Mycobacterium tuberculosis]CKR59849.1 Uncharacterised protein [Mycobacterium tuberculosis]CKS50901.1 Uncharacterised protein [Mycobacterium tuberculosis]CNU06944.1 Uncharacterised protein [Mycobacterium tuberculosis]COW25241.1 Uncharacterised protein [Mycobacterium tuberculosis]